MKQFFFYFHFCIPLLIVQAAFSQPSLTGKIVYHTYSDYNAWDSELYILDLSTGIRTHVSPTWNIDHEMNAHWSPDGTQLVFMGDVTGEPRNWDVFIWTVGSSQPVNLTNGGGRDEDPKFSPNGQRIVFKSDNDLWQMDLSGNRINNVTNTSAAEESMPFYTADGNSILYALGVGAGSDIYKINADGSDNQALVDVAGTQEYFPIVRDNTSFFYTTWQNASDLHDQIYLKNFSGGAGVRLPFNTSTSNYSDAYPVGSEYMLISSDRPGGKGNYDVYIADINSGQLWSLDSYNSNVNSSWQDLGACYGASVTLGLLVPNFLSDNGEDRRLNQEIQVIPNPSHGSFIVPLKSTEIIQAIHLTDLQGTNVSFDYQIQANQLQVTSMERGMFILVIHGQENVYHAKVTIEK